MASIVLDALAGSSISLGPLPATTGAIALSNNTAIYWRNAANSGDLKALFVDASNLCVIGTGCLQTWVPNTFAIGNATATTGIIQFAQSQYIKARNAANNADVPLIGTDGADNIMLGDATHPAGIKLTASAGNAISHIVNATTVASFATGAGGIQLGADNAAANINIKTSSTTTAPSGGASTTVTPAGYINVQINGVAQKMAYYNNA